MAESGSTGSVICYKSPLHTRKASWASLSVTVNCGFGQRGPLEQNHKRKSQKSKTDYLKSDKISTDLTVAFNFVVPQF